MRILSATLSAQQKSLNLDPLIKIQLTQGANDYTYTRTRIWSVAHDQEPYSHKATVVLNNSDGTLTDIDFKGYQGVISKGLVTSAGEEYSPYPPLTVVDQKFVSNEGILTCELTLWGLPNMLAEDRASAVYAPDSANTDTVKTIINAILGATLACFNHCTAYTVDWDSEDALIDVFQPKDAFRIYINGSRLAAVRRLLDYTKCGIRFGDDGHIHVFVEKNPNVDVGSAATDRASSLSTSTYIDLANAVNTTGNITSVEIWAATNMTGFRVGTFYLVSGTTYKCRDSATIGAVNAGSKQTFTGLSIEAVAGDFIGCYFATGTIDRDATGSGVRYYGAESIDAGDEASFDLYAGLAISLYGIGIAYDYEYSLTSGDHTFFSKAYRQALVIPNKIVVASQTGDSPAYTGNATSAASYALMPKVQYETTRLASNAQATAISEAMIAKYEIQSETGGATVPINVGAELYDYVKVTDSRENDSRIGNIGYIHDRYNYKQGKWEMNFGFGGWLSVRGLVNDLETNPSGLGNDGQLLSRLLVKNLYAENIVADNIDMTSVTVDVIGEGTTYKRTKSAAINANGMVLLDQVVEGTNALVLATDVSAGHIKLTTSTVWSGKVTVIAGVTIDSAAGINIFGVDNGLTTRATEAGTVQCSVNSSGQITAGAGAVKLDVNGISFTGTGYAKWFSGASFVGYIEAPDTTHFKVTTYDAGMYLSLYGHAGIELLTTTICSVNLGILTTNYFGLLLSTTVAGKLNWFTDGGTLDHVFGPDVADYGWLGSDALYWHAIAGFALSAKGGVYPNTAYLTPGGYCGSAGYYWIQVHSDEYVTHSPKKVEAALSKTKAIKFKTDGGFDYASIPADIVADGTKSLEFVKNHKRRAAESEIKTRIHEAKGNKTLEAEAQADYDKLVAELDAQTPVPGIGLGALSTMLLCAVQELTAKVETLEGRLP